VWTQFSAQSSDFFVFCANSAENISPYLSSQKSQKLKKLSENLKLEREGSQTS